MTLLLLALLGCGGDDPCAGVRDLEASPAGLVLTAEEHGVGWGQAACGQCHAASATHRADCIGGVDLDALNAATDFSDPASCLPCHGANGVEGWDTGGAP